MWAERKKRRRNGYRRQMSLGIQPPSFSCSCSLCRLHIHAHILSNGMGQWLRTWAYNTWKAAKTPPHPLCTHTHSPPDRKLPAFDFDLATLLLAWSTLIQAHWSFISLCLFGGGSTARTRSACARLNSMRGTVWKQAAGCTALAMVGASVHFVYSLCPAWVLQNQYHLVVTPM